MNPRLQRANILLAQSRPADAEQELLRALAESPRDAALLATLALSRVRQDQPQNALPPAVEAVGLDPDWAFTHYMHAVVLRDLGKARAARKALDEAIRLDPHDADNFTLKASINLAESDWAAALEAAGHALQLAPEDETAANLRSMALVRLGRKDEALATIDRTLEQAPDNAFSHANQGWNHLHRNDPRRAREHFMEALRLDANCDYAREGLLESLKATNPVYRAMLGYFLWMARQSGKMQWAFVIAIIFGDRFIQGVAAANPGLAWVTLPLRVLLYGFIYLSWTASPMFNLVLLTDRFGRRVLKPRERTMALVFGATFALLLVALGLWIAGVPHGRTLTLISAYVSALTASSVQAEGGRALVLGGLTALLAVIGFTAFALITAGSTQGVALLGFFLLGSLALAVGQQIIKK